MSTRIYVEVQGESTKSIIEIYVLINIFLDYIYSVGQPRIIQKIEITVVKPWFSSNICP